MDKLTTKNKIKYLLIAVVCLVIILAVVLYLYARAKENRTYATFDTVESVTLEGTSVVGYGTTSEGIFRYSRDGAEVIGETGDEVWNVSYNMSNPVADICGKCAAVGDKGARTLYIFDGTGAANPITTPYAIEKVVVASQGVTAVWMNDGTSDYISLYDVDGNVLVDMNTLTSADGFPVDIALSKDGNKLVTTYVDFEDETMRTQLTFYNFGDVGENYVDNLVGLEKFEGTLIGDVAFLTSDVCVAFGEKGFTIFNMEEIPEKILTVDVPEEIKMVAYSNKYFGLVVKNADASYTARIYNASGKVVDARSFVETYGHFQIEGEEVVLYDDMALYAYRVNGSDIITTAFQKSVDYLLPIDTSHLLVIGGQYADQIKLIGKEE